MSIREAFEFQSKACASLGSPFMGQLMGVIGRRLEHGTSISDRVLGWPGDPSPSADSVPLRLAGALHALRLEGRALTSVYPPNRVDDDALWLAVFGAMERFEEHIHRWLDSPPQTNEVSRSAVILAGLGAVRQRYDQPADLLELGTSGGLNLRADRYRLHVSGMSVGPSDARVVLTPEWRGALPKMPLPDIRARMGVDLAPLDPTSAAGQLRLQAYLWPDQTDRLERTKAAITEAKLTPAEVTSGDAGAWLEAALANEADDRLRIVFHTVAWQYFPEATAKQALRAMEQTRTPLVRLAMEADGGEGALVSLTHYPSGELQILGRADFHGRWIDWRE